MRSSCNTDAGSSDECVFWYLAHGHDCCAFLAVLWVLDALNVSHAVADFVAIGGSGWAAALGGGSAWTRSRGFAQCPVGDRAGGWSD